MVPHSEIPILMDQSIKPDPEIVAELEPFRLEVEQLGSMPIGRTRVRLSRPCSLGECSLGNMITDAMVEEYVALAPENAWTYAAIAMMNSGGIRAEISELNDGGKNVKTKFIKELSILCDECDIPEYQPLNLTKWYRIAMASFLAEGGDDFGIIPQNRRNHNMGKNQWSEAMPG
uniref:5'-Nucleotidase C-terminal domain-containing protein n=1 Tax=Timema monikensis TaxID=170555 RepID=A0A7R9HIH9_9NEOP|nr:unnamed protein product [Timema monikensis]